MPAFIGYVKQESAHAVNRLLKRRKKTVWAEGYDSPPVLDLARFVESFVYCLLNPMKDNLVSNMELFKGVSSYKYFMRKELTRECLVISRDSIPGLTNPHSPELENYSVMKVLKERNKEKITLKFDFYSWKNAFEETKGLTDEEAYNLLLNAVREKEKQISEELGIKAGTFKASKVHSMLKVYTPKKYGKKMICLAKDIKKRIAYIRWFRVISERAKDVYRRWKKGDFSIPFPAGMFAPCQPRLANLYSPI